MARIPWVGTETLASFKFRGYPWLWLSISLNGMALVSLADKLFAVLGALSAGLLLSLVGAAGAFSGMGFAYFFSALSLIGVKRAYRWEGNTQDGLSSEEETAIPTERPTGKFTKNLVMIWKNPGLLLLAGIAVTMEVFAFSSDVLLPSFARDIFKVGESGLGVMTAARNVGGVVGVLVLAGISTRVRQGPLLGIACVAFGLGLIAFASSPAFALALFVLFIIGMMWASVDSLLPTLLQYSVRDEERGTSVGVWNLSRGLGPLGHLEVGALAGAIGTSLALTINGGLIIVIVALIILLYRSKGFHWPSVKYISKNSPFD
jgi:MFS family permease